MSKIDKLVQEKGIKPSDCAYHTWRDVRNSKGDVAGRMRILVLKADNIARCEYKCPECQKEGYSESEWKRPFSFKCEHCGYKITVPKMRQEFKREMKKSQKK